MMEKPKVLVWGFTQTQATLLKVLQQHCIVFAPPQDLRWMQDKGNIQLLEDVVEKGSKIINPERFVEEFKEFLYTSYDIIQQCFPEPITLTKTEQERLQAIASETAIYGAALEVFHEEHHFDCLIVNSSSSAFRRTVVMTAKELGILTVNLEHGYVSTLPGVDAQLQHTYFPFMTDITNLDNKLEILYWNSHQKKLGVELTTFWDCGTQTTSPEKKPLSKKQACQQLAIPISYPVITVFCSWINASSPSNILGAYIEEISFFESVVTLSKKFREQNEAHTIVVRLHPAYTLEQCREIQAYLNDCCSEAQIQNFYVFAANIPLQTVLSATDVAIINAYSSVAWDCFLTSLPVIIYPKIRWASVTDDIHILNNSSPLYKNGALYVVDSDEEFYEQVEYLLQNIGQSKKHIESIVKSYALPNRSSEEKATAFVEKLLTTITHRKMNSFSLESLQTYNILPRFISDVRSWQGHIPFAMNIVEMLQPSILVELGTHKGDSFNAFCEAIQLLGLPTKAYAVDCWEGDEHAGFYENSVYAVLEAYNQPLYGSFATLKKMFFEEAVNDFEDGSIDLLHIDGLHTYDAVRSDFETWLPKMSSKGVVLFHDTQVFERGFGVNQYWNEIKVSYPNFEFLHSHGLGVLFVGNQMPEKLAPFFSMNEIDQLTVRKEITSLGKIIFRANPRALVTGTEKLSKAKKKISIVIPVYNKIDLTAQCLSSIFVNTPSTDQFEVIVVDNGSTDATQEILQKYQTEFEDIVVVTNTSNRGFAKACNQGYAVAKGEFVVFLNNDTIVSAGWLQILRSTFDDETVGIAGPLLLYPQEGMIIQHAGVDIGKVEDTIFPFHIFRGRSIDETPQALQKKEYFAVTGACLMIRKELLDKYGAFDERFLNSYEDVDLCLRIKSKGCKIVYNPASIVVHLESQTPGRNDNDKQNQQLLNSIWAKTIPVTAESYLRMVESLTRDVLIENPQSMKSMENLIFVYKELGENHLLQKYQQLYSAEEKNQKPKVEVSIVIPIYNGLQYTRQCLKHLVESTSQSISFEIIIVDYASTDGSKEVLEEIKKNTPFLQYIRNEENLGFAKACNQGIAAANGRYIVLLNNDTMPTPRWLDELYQTMEQNHKIGIAGSLLLFPETEWIQHAGIQIGRYEDEQTVIDVFPIHPFQYCHKNTLQTSLPFEVPAVTGACMIIRKEVIASIGTLDEEFVNGCEDVDFCFRANNAGYEIVVVPKSVVFHYEGRTEGRANKTNENLQLLSRKYSTSNLITLSVDETFNHYHFARLQELRRMDVNSIEVTNTALTIAQKLQIETEVLLLTKTVEFQSLEKPVISIVIPVKNNVQYTKHCIESIKEFTTKNCYEIIVVDNNSNDETAVYIQSVKEEISIHYILNEIPQTYSVSNNQGALAAKGKYLVFLNNDTKLFPTWAEQMVHSFEENEIIAIQGARLLYPNHTIQHAGIEFNQEILRSKGAFVHQHSFLTFDAWNEKVTESRSVTMVTGAFLAIRKSVFDSINGFDEQFRFGHEDLDLCLSAIQKDFQVVYNASIVAYHYESKTKLEEGIERFQRFLNDPTNIDFQNQQYFDSKWKSFLEMRYTNKTENVSTPKRILMTMFGWNESGGGTSYPKAIAKSLVKLGNNVTVVYAGGKSSESQQPYHIHQSFEGGVQLIGIYNRPTTFLDEKNFQREIRDTNIEAIFRTILSNSNPEIVHFHNFLGLGYSLATIAKEYGATTYFTTHNYHCIDPKLYMIHDSLQRWKSVSFEENSDVISSNPKAKVDYSERKHQILSILNSNIDRIFPVSERQKKLFEEFGIQNNKMCVLNQIAEIHSQGQVPKDNRTVHNPLQIAYIGGVMPHKGVHVLVASVQPFANSQVQVKIIGFVEPKYKEVLVSIDSKKIISWEGSYTINDLPQKLSNIDLVVLPSLWEDCAPLTISEALGFGKPVVAPSLGGFTDFVFHGVNGYLYNPDDPKALVEILNKIISDKTILRTLKSNSFVPYGFNDLVQKYHRIYQNSDYSELRFEDELFKKISPSTEETLQEHTVGFSKSKAQGRFPNPLPNPLYLNLGCGNDVRDDCINIDLYSDNPTVVYMDIRKLQLPDGCVDGIIASDVLEHFSHRETESILKEWSRVLKKGGEIVLRSPSLRKQAEMYLRGVWDADIASFMIFGGQSNPGDFHCIGFDETTIRRYFQRVGLQVFKYEEPDIPQDKGYRNINFTVWATKK